MKKKSGFSKIMGAKGAGTVVTAFIGLIIIYIAFGILNPKVFTLLNIQNLLRSMSKYLLIGIGQSFVMITGNVDLSIGSVVGMSAMISATMMTKGMNPIVAIIVTIVLALVVGVVNGYLVGKFKLPPFIATLGTMFIARGIAYIVNNNRNTDNIASGIGKEAGDRFQNIFYYGKTAGIFNTFWIALIIFLIFWFFLARTRSGRHIYAIGSNVDLDVLREFTDDEELVLQACGAEMLKKLVREIAVTSSKIGSTSMTLTDATGERSLAEVAGAKKEQMVEAVQEMKQDILGMDDLTDLDDMDIEFDEGW